MKLEKLIKKFDNNIIIGIYENTNELYKGEIWDIPIELLDYKLDPNEEIFLKIESIPHDSADLCLTTSMIVFITGYIK